MKSIRIAAYLLIAIRFLRVIRRKLLPDTAGLPRDDREMPVNINVATGASAVSVATCIDRRTASIVVVELRKCGIHTSAVECKEITEALSTHTPFMDILRSTRVYLHPLNISYVARGDYEGGKPLPGIRKALDNAMAKFNPKWTAAYQRPAKPATP